MCISRERMKLLLPVMTAWADGEIIQLRASKTAEWYDAIDPPSWSFDPENYRIKPLPKKLYVVFNGNEEILATRLTEEAAQKLVEDYNSYGRYKPYTFVSYTEDTQ